MLGSLWFSAFSAGGNGAAADYELISTTVLGSSAASVTFSGLGTSAAAYKHLQIRMVSRMDENVGYPLGESWLRFNGISTNSYSWHWLYGNGSTVYSQAVTNTSRIVASRLSSANATANTFGASVIDILDPFTSAKNTTVRTLTGVEQSASGSGELRAIHLTSGAYYSATPITSIALLPNSGNFVTGSRFSLYGLKG